LSDSARSATVPTRSSRSPLPGRALRRVLWKKLHVPRAILHPALSNVKRWLAPGEVARRRACADEAVPGAFEIDATTGDCRFGPGELPGAREAIRTCRQVFAGQEGSRGALFNPNKRFLRALLSGSDFCAHPELLRFLVSRPLLDPVTRYLGTVPLLAGAALWWSLPNRSTTASQRFHFDQEDERVVKIFLNVFDVDEQSGPLTWLPADVSERATRRLGVRDGRLDDAAVLGVEERAARQLLTGPAGSGAFVDTARCLHYGSRRNEHERLVLMIQFLRFDAPSESTFDLRVPPGLLGSAPDEHQRLALGNR
jgi:hypothetical protein